MKSASCSPPCSLPGRRSGSVTAAPTDVGCGSVHLGGNGPSVVQTEQGQPLKPLVGCVMASKSRRALVERRGGQGWRRRGEPCAGLCEGSHSCNSRQRQQAPPCCVAVASETSSGPLRTALLDSEWRTEVAAGRVAAPKQGSLLVKTGCGWLDLRAVYEPCTGN